MLAGGVSQAGGRARSLGSVPDEVVGLHFKTVMHEKVDIFKHFKITVRCHAHTVRRTWEL